MNAPALLVQTSFDTDANGIPESVTSETYSASGKILRRALDSNADGQADTVTNYIYNDSGSQTGLFIDNDNDGTVDYSFTTDYTTDANGILTITATSRDAITGTDDVYISKFDSAGNLIEEAAGTNGGEVQVTDAYTYNSSGQITVYETGGSRTDYTYDAAGQISGSENANVSIAYAYDEAGNIVRQETNSPTFGSSSVTVYTYDEENRLVGSSLSGNTANSPFGGGFSNQITYEYNAAGQITSFVLSSNSSGRGSGSLNTYEYDEAGNLIRESSVGTGFSSGLSTESNYEYNEAGQVTAYIRATTISSVGRTTEIRYTYEYNESGQVKKTSFGGDDFNGAVDGRITEYSYDSAGRLTAQSIDTGADGTIDDVTSYAYDELLTGGVGSMAVANESSSVMGADGFNDVMAQSIGLGTGGVFSSGELASRSLLASSTFLDSEASLIPTDQFSI